MHKFMKSFATASVVLAVVAAGSAPVAWSHSLKDLQTQLGDREKYFQPIDKDGHAFTLQDAGGHAVRLADFRGKVVVLHFIYPNCPDVCPVHAERIAEIQALTNQSPRKQQVEFITITTDPSRDKGEVLRNYGPAHGLDPANWIFLTTKPDQAEDTTRHLAEAFGHRFDKTEDGYQTHGIVTHVIDKEGRWRAEFHRRQFEPTNLLGFVNALGHHIEKPHCPRQPSPWGELEGPVGA